MFWSPRFVSWKEEDRVELYAAIKEEDGTERKVLRLVLTCSRNERTLEDGKPPVK